MNDNSGEVGLQDQIEDAALISLIQTGNPTEASDAFAQLVARYGQRLLRHLSTKGLSIDECELVSQNTWLRAWKLIDSYEERGFKFFTWLRKVADNVAHEYDRERYRVPSAVSLDDAKDDVEGGAIDPEDLALADLNGEEIGHVVKGVLREAPEDFRTVIESLFFCDFGTEDIMHLTNWSQSKVYTTKHRALTWLKEEILRRYGPSRVQDWLDAS